ncbi:MAG: hypothetical protein OXL37_04465 [Chloroflexota bacterium]|nr:hypothetical protein [Chloroflexota bacterium]MDE2960964.1 hypothetical protein [Chloroflexota bacterium]
MTASNQMSFEERERRAFEIYESKIRPLIGPGDESKYVKIDVLSGDYEIGENSATAGRILRTRRPGGVISTIQGHRPRVIKLRSPRRTVRVSKAQQ